jgi:hypothetical protein
MDVDELTRLASSSSSCTVSGEVDDADIDAYAKRYPIEEDLSGDELNVWNGLDDNDRKYIQSDRAFYGAKLESNITFHDILGIRMVDGLG